MQIPIKKIYDDARIFSRAHSSDAGLDMYAYGEHRLLGGETCVVGTGIAACIEEGYVGLIFDKSSIGAKGVTTLGGVIDAGYRGEIKVILHNLTKQEYVFNHGDKIAQLLIQKVSLGTVVEVQELSETERGEGGFGSTGRS